MDLRPSRSPGGSLLPQQLWTIQRLLESVYAGCEDVSAGEMAPLQAQPEMR